MKRKLNYKSDILQKQSDIIFAYIIFNCQRQYHYEVIALRSNITRR